MRLIFSEQAWEDYLYWQQNDARRGKKLNRLIQECLRTPHSGSGKPEPLRGALSGWWSRRIDREHRLVYRYTDAQLETAQCRYHY